jgi:hypothetical protein
MNAKRACLVALVMTLAGASAARAQYGPPATGNSGALPSAALPAPGPEPSAADAPVPPPTGPRLSDYILGTRPDCCGPVGGNGPISTELYVRWGPSVNLQTGFLSKVLETGWEVQAGGRVLFFNPQADAAWTLEVGFSDVSNQGQHDDRVAHLFSVLVPIAGGGATRVNNVGVTVRSLNRTYANLGFGREWYLLGPAANCPGCGTMPGGPNWRVGIDVGGRYGTEKMNFHEFQHRTEVIEGAWAALHTDLEYPCGGVVVLVGGRVEWDNTWMHQILQDIPENLQNLNVLMTLGLRY